MDLIKSLFGDLFLNAFKTLQRLSLLRETTLDPHMVGVAFLKFLCNVSSPPVHDSNCEENVYKTFILLNLLYEMLYSCNE